jgi:Spy/CpxP family protein refolding chaperone
MKNTMLTALVSASLVSCLSLTSCARTKSDTASAAPAQSTSQSHAQSDFDKQQKDTEQRAQPEIEKQRQQVQEEGEKSLDKDAISAIEETNKAVSAIAANKIDEARAAIERATGKIEILVARNSATALIPVGLQVDVIDAAPQDSKAILEIAKNASEAVDAKDFPTARLLLRHLASEILVRTYSLPLVSYPLALTEAARLLDQHKTQDADIVLLTALNTLAVIDRVTPLPLLLARAAIDQARDQSQKDKAAAQTLLETAKKQLQRSKDLGYAGRDPEYTALNSDISNLEKQLKGNEDATSVFAKLEDKFSAFLKRQSERERR